MQVTGDRFIHIIAAVALIAAIGSALPAAHAADVIKIGAPLALTGSLADEAKKQDLVMDYKILLGNAATPQDFDILIMVERKNMAGLDGLREKFDPIARKIVGTPDQQLATQTKRLEIREIMGSKNMREITLK